MKLTTRHSIIISMLICGCLLAGGISARAGVIETWEKDFEVASGGNLYIESDLGSIYIGTNDMNLVKAEIIVSSKTRSERKIEDILEDMNVEFEQDGDDVSIFLQYDRKHSWSLWGNSNRSLKIEINVSVPKEYNLDLYTAGGGIEVEDLKGEVLVETSGGGLTFEDIEGTIEGKTSGGGISLESCSGDVDVKTSGGAITVGKVSGNVQAHTSGGSIQVDEVFGVIDATTSGGSITAHIEGQPEDDCRLSTSGGSVTVYLDRDININIDAKTSAGRVDTDFPVTIRGKMRKSSLRGKINDGGPEMYLRTSAGNINIREI